MLAGRRRRNPAVRPRAAGVGSILRLAVPGTWSRAGDGAEKAYLPVLALEKKSPAASSGPGRVWL